jgi:hypothetical protein
MGTSLTLGDDQVKVLQTYLRGQRCRICSHDDFVINNTLFCMAGLAPPRPDGHVPAAAVIAVSCAMCGHLEFFNARQYGVGTPGTPGA